MKWSDKSAVEAYRTCLQLLEVLLTVETSAQLREHLDSIPSIERLATDGAACAIHHGQIKSAVEMVEQGRRVLQTGVGSWRSQFDDLEAMHPTMAEDLRKILMQLEATVVPIGRQTTQAATRSPTQDFVATYVGHT